MTSSIDQKGSGAWATPGPWFVFDHYCGRDPATAGEEYAATRLIGLGQFDTIAEVRMGSEDVAGDVDANARLIAAAPELLAALRWLRAWWKPGSNHDTDEVQLGLAAADAAIAKSEQSS